MQASEAKNSKAQQILLETTTLFARSVEMRKSVGFWHRGTHGVFKVADSFVCHRFHL